MRNMRCAVVSVWVFKVAQISLLCMKYHKYQLLHDNHTSLKSRLIQR